MRIFQVHEAETDPGQFEGLPGSTQFEGEGTKPSCCQSPTDYETCKIQL